MTGKIGRGWPGIQRNWDNVDKLIIVQLLQTYYHPPRKGTVSNLKKNSTPIKRNEVLSKDEVTSNIDVTQQIKNEVTSREIDFENDSSAPFLKYPGN